MTFWAIDQFQETVVDVCGIPTTFFGVAVRNSWGCNVTVAGKSPSYGAAQTNQGHRASKRPVERPPSQTAKSNGPAKGPRHMCRGPFDGAFDRGSRTRRVGPSLDSFSVLLLALVLTGRRALAP